MARAVSCVNLKNRYFSRPAIEPLLQRLQPHLEAGDLHELRGIVRDIEARIARFEQLKQP